MCKDDGKRRGRSVVRVGKRESGLVLVPRGGFTGPPECQPLTKMDNHATTESMNVNLTPELEKLIQDKVASGLYNNQSEVVREALRLLADQDRVREAHLTNLRGALAEGLLQADRGELREGPEAMAELKRSMRKGRAAKKKTG